MTYLSRIYIGVMGILAMFLPQLAWAVEPGGGYKGIASMYYGVIAVILIYGVYDIFGKQVVKYVGPVIAIIMYFAVPDV